jgi:hypothetical protein
MVRTIQARDLSRASELFDPSGAVESPDGDVVGQ